ncbi:MULTISPECIES: hypothetical protein [unclassified Nostoc]|uniref:hypothetical protein n=1 Tax=unclassified Nostoc TaxID=2593658 RepID=UPI0025AB1FD6|nr:MULTISPECIES: hypothetical protein [unclassified Nostoc]MDM9580753.1 hypothetical protein [Nostoc sp. GT001]MDZ7994643.1 hypothetical protein [Nostoc sp. EspVER01]
MRVIKKAERSHFPTKIFLKLLSLETIMQRFLTAFLLGQKAKFVLEKPNAEDLVFLK